MKQKRWRKEAYSVMPTASEASTRMALFKATNQL